MKPSRSVKASERSFLASIDQCVLETAAGVARKGGALFLADPDVDPPFARFACHAPPPCYDTCCWFFLSPSPCASNPPEAPVCGTRCSPCPRGRSHAPYVRVFTSRLTPHAALLCNTEVPKYNDLLYVRCTRDCMSEPYQTCWSSCNSDVPYFFCWGRARGGRGGGGWASLHCTV